jgi:hypothetical protein
MPRSVTLVASDGAVKTFDLSDPNESRDLSLTPRLIEWIEEHFFLEKLRVDYPHWDDAWQGRPVADMAPNVPADEPSGNSETVSSHVNTPTAIAVEP